MNNYSQASDLETFRGKHILDTSQIKMVEEALSSLGEYGQVRLVVEKGHLRFIIIEKSYDALKWAYGSLSRQVEERTSASPWSKARCLQREKQSTRRILWDDNIR